ncbi:hypothetical protein L2E82_02668 [Cichorium intybus]|uniref:Uncharacterized protein n=1 Tax=Cichorium intybus TaxID=13427 RepID=A0ACB9H1X7_CICIN|nr:hypothetical protein L2E82_02668 [Cichorium intybus]
MEEMQQTQETMDVPMSTVCKAGTPNTINRVLADKPVETLDDQEDTEDEGIEETHPPVEMKEKTRRPSERIINKKLRKKIDGT